MVKITVLTTTYRPWDRLIGQLYDLEMQSFRDIEWVVVDDLFCKRAIKLESDNFPITHVLPHGGVVDYFAPARADNSGLIYAQGELVFWMNDYVRLTPTVLERHWELYQKYGPQAMVMGPMVPMDGELTYPPRLPEFWLEDGAGEILGKAIAQYSAGRNDSAPLKDLLEINGLDENMDGQRGGSDVDLALRLMMHGCRMIVDSKVTCFDYAHHPETNPAYPWDKKLPGHKGGPWQKRFEEVQHGADLWAQNGWSIRNERRNGHE